jgi:hypothetical protein
MFPVFQPRQLHPRMSAAEPPAKTDGAPKASGVFVNRETFWVWRRPLWVKRAHWAPMVKCSSWLKSRMGMVASPMGSPLGRLIGPMGNPMRIRGHWHLTVFFLTLAPFSSRSLGSSTWGWRSAQRGAQWAVGEPRRDAGGPDGKGARETYAYGIAKREEGRLETGDHLDAVAADRRRRERKI